MFGFGEHDVSTGWAVTVGVIVGMTLWVVLAARALRVSRVVPQVPLSPGAVALVGRVAAREPVEKGQAFDLTLGEGTSIRVVPTRRALITTRGARSWERGAFSPGDWVRAEGMLSGAEHDGYRARAWTLEAVEVAHLSNDPRVPSRLGPALAPYRSCGSSSPPPRSLPSRSLVTALLARARSWPSGNAPTVRP